MLGLVILMLTATSGNAEPIRCNISQKFKCSVAGCKDNQLDIWNLVNLKSNKFSRCDRNGCDHYDMIASRSGLFIILDVPGRGMLAKIRPDDESYLEIVTVGMSALISYGSPKYNM